MGDLKSCKELPSVGTYDPECMFPTEAGGRFCAQRIISGEEMTIFTQTGKNYQRKAEKYPEKQFRKILPCNGLKIRKAYAQAFSVGHLAVCSI
jgi:hypothetical protein